MKLKKGSIEAKQYMAKIRAMKSGTKKKATKKKSLGATKFVEKKEPKNTKPKRTIQITRRSDGTFKNFKSLGATKFLEKKEPKSTKPKRTIQITRKADGTFKNFKQIGSIHKDTKSHNVRINVLSGNSLTPTQKKLYTKLMNEYDSKGWYKIVSFDNFINVQYENAIKKNNRKLSNDIYYVMQYAQNDF